MRILTISVIIFHIIITHNIALCNLHTHNLQSYANNKYLFQKNSNQQQTIKSYTHHHDDITNALNLNANYIPNKKNVYMYYHDISPIICTNFASKVQIQNDSINIFHSFCKKHNNIYQKTLSFVQLGIRDILSEQIVNFGIGKRYTPNNVSMIGYHTFYNCPIVKNNYYTNNKQTHSINLSVEYWFYNMLFIFNNYYNLSNIISSTQESYKYNIYNPKNSHQIYIQTKFPYFSEFTGKIKLEQFFYNKRYQKIFKQKNHDYCLSLCLNYQPIPILGIDVNNVFIHKKCNTNCKILINYQFGVPLAQQINYINKKNTPISHYLDTIIQPFTPTIIQYHDNIVYNQYDDIHHLKSLQNIQEITGYPGEIKIIEANKNYQSEKWDFQQLKNKGGHISTISDNTYAIILPNNPILKENEIYISYNSNTIKNSIEQKPKKINILVKDILEKQISNTQPHTSQIINNDVNSEINITDNTIQGISIPNTENNNKENGVSNSNTTKMPQYHIRDDVINTKLVNNITTTKKDDDAIILLSPPPPPPIPTNFLKIDKPLSTTNEQLTQSSSLLSCSTPYKDDTSNNTNDDSKEKIDDISIIQHYHMQSNNQNDNLSYRLAQHKKSKFSSIGTKEHINKLESTITKRKKSKYISSDMEKILIKLNIASSSSSINEDYITDNSEDNFSDTNYDDE